MSAHKNSKIDAVQDTARIVLTVTTALLLLGLHWTISHTSTVDPAVRSPYVPPLTHTPGLGPSMIGTHSEPPFALLEALPLSGQERSRVDKLFTQHRNLLNQSVAHRLAMQSGVLQILNELPSTTVQQSIEERALHTQTIGELNVWQTVLEQRRSQ